MIFIIGDSHARGLEREGWNVLSTGGATASGLINPDSETQAGRKSTEYIRSVKSSEKVILTVFGEVDCVDHHTSDLGPVMDRYLEFLDSLRNLDDVVGVFPCAVFPRKSDFKMYGLCAQQFQDRITQWNEMLPYSVDTFNPLLGPDGFLVHDFSANPNDLGERHLSKSGSAVVCRVIESFASVAAPPSKRLKR